MTWRVALAALLTLCLALLQPPLQAQFNGCQAGFCAPKAVGGGGSASVAVLFTATATTGSTAPYTIVSGVTFSTGVAAVGVAWDQSGGVIAPTGITINGVTATQIGTKVSDGTSNGVEFWYAAVSAGTGNIVLTGSGTFGEIAVNGFMITGASSNTPATSGQTNGFAVQQADPQGPIALSSLASGSVAVGVIGRNFAIVQNPTTWAGVSRNATAEASNASGNQIIIAGGSASGLSGTVNVSATATSGQSWQYSGMLAAAWH